MNWYRELEPIVRAQVPLAASTTYRVGGPAQFFAEPPDEETLCKVLRRSSQDAIPVLILGHGTNLLVADRGVPGLVLRLPVGSFSSRSLDDVVVKVGARHSLPGLVKWSVDEGLSGLEFLAGVPGTVGAALRMNAGGKYGEIGERVSSVWGVTRTGEPFHYSAAECGFRYRDSGLGNLIVTGCTLNLDAGDQAAARARIREILQEKSASQPLSSRSAGCVFKNPKQEGVPSAGKLIDDAGLKGERIGGAQVSTRHANFLVCDRMARAGDLVSLIRRIRRRVLDEFDVPLDLEIAAWGFGEQELLPQSA